MYSYIILYPSFFILFFFIQYFFQATDDVGELFCHVVLLTDVLLQVVQLFVWGIAEFDVRQLVVGGSLAGRDIVPCAVVDRERRGRGLDDVVAPDVVRPYQGVQIVTAVGSRTFGYGLSTKCASEA